MSEQDLIAALEPWMRVDTWHTSHPLDQRRFHKALANAFDKVETPIDAERFESAMRVIAAKHHASLDPRFLEETVRELAEQAEGFSIFDHNSKSR